MDALPIEEDVVDQEEVVELKDGKAAPVKRGRGRPPGSKNKKSTDTVVAKASPKTVKISLARGAGEKMLKGAARLPVYLADVAGTMVTKGKFQLVDFITEDQFQECDKAFIENMLGALEIECDPMWAWPITCGLVVGSGVVMGAMQYAIALKLSAGKLKVPENAKASGVNGSGGSPETSQRLEEIREQPGSGQGVAA